MMNKDQLLEKEYEQVKKNIDKILYVDLIIWRNELITIGEVNNPLFRLLNGEILNRAYALNKDDNKEKSR